MSLYKEKMESLLFFKLEKENIKKLFNIEKMAFGEIQEIYFPLEPSKFVNKVASDEKISSIPVGLFIEGMFYVIACDEKFKYNDIYKYIILKNSYNYFNHIKRKISDLVKENKNYEAYILLIGLCRVEDNLENHEKLILVGSRLVGLDKDINSELIEFIDIAIKKHNYINGYRIKAHVFYNQEKYDEAIINISRYIELNGKLDEQDEVLYTNLKINRDYEKAKSLIYDNPSEALKILIPLSKGYENNVMMKLHMAICYRLLEIYERAIIYLEEALLIDSDLVDIYNELGLNYALIEEYEKSILYFKKAFDATASIEICTNLIMSLMNFGKHDEAKSFLEIGEKLNPQDEIILDLKKLLA